MGCFLPTNHTWRYRSFESFLREATELGAHDLDVWLCNQHVNIDAHDVYNLDEVLDLCSRYDARVQTLTPEQSNPKAYNLSAPDEELRTLTFEYYRQLVRLARALDAKRISLNTGWHFLDEDVSRARDRLVQMLQAICDLAGENGIDVCVEPLLKKPYRFDSSPSGLAELIGDVGSRNMFVTLDTGTIVRNGGHIEDYLEVLGSKVAYCHLTNACEGASGHLSWGDRDGSLDAGDLIETMAAYGYDGDYALEMTRECYFLNPKENLRRSLEKLGKGRG